MIAASADSPALSPARSYDRVALSGSIVALAGCSLLPFAEFSANRIVNGQALTVFASAGPLWGVALYASLALTAAAAFAPRAWRGPAVLGSAIVALGVLLFACGAAAVRLTPPGDTPARVSVGGGAWLMLAGLGMVWYQGSRSTADRRVSLAAALAAMALLVAAGLFGGLAMESLAIEYHTNADRFWVLFVRHVMLSLGGVALGALIGIPLGIVAARSRWVKTVAIPTVSVIQTVPSLALLGLLMLVLTALALPSIGTVPTLIALTLYSLLPIVRNTLLGIAGVDPSVVDSGQGMGMGRRQLLWRVEFPLALPLIIEGLRSALVLTIGITAVMAIVGAQDLGTLIYEGIGFQANDLILLGAIPMVLLAIIADQAMRLVEGAVVSPGIRGGQPS